MTERHCWQRDAEIDRQILEYNTMCRAHGVIYSGSNVENKYVLQDPEIRQSGEQGLEAENYHQAKMKSYLYYCTARY